MSSSRPTIDDVARVAGVSRATASRVINDAPGASGPLRARVRDAVDLLGYRPNESARALASGRPRSIEVIGINDGPDDRWLGGHPYYGRVLAGVMSVLEGADVQLRLHAVRSDAPPEAIEAIAASTTAGAILATVTPAMAARFHRRCRRAVSLVASSPSVPVMAADNIGGAYTAVTQLHALGRRRIAAIHGPVENPCAIDRRIGYLRATGELQLPDISADGGFLREGGYHAARHLLDRDPDIDAMFVTCDLMAAGAVQAITATGRRVPEDVNIIGFDDSIVASCTNPPLSTMRLPVEEMAASAARLLLAGPIAAGYRERFSVEYVARQSTSPLAA